jgi:hypothetical protein
VCSRGGRGRCRCSRARRRVCGPRDTDGSRNKQPFGETHYLVACPSVSEGVGRFRLADGEVVDLYAEGLRAVYDELWSVSDQPGAVSAAALVRHAEQSAGGRRLVELNERESAAFRLARSRLSHLA